MYERDHAVTDLSHIAARGEAIAESAARIAAHVVADDDGGAVVDVAAVRRLRAYCANALEIADVVLSHAVRP